MGEKATIVFKAKDELIPVPFIDKVIVAGMTHAGYGIRQGNTVATEIGQEAVSSDQINEMQEAFKDEEIFIAFMNPKEFKHKEDYLPIKMFMDKDDAVMVGFAEGNFNNFIPSGSDHSNEYFMFNKYLIPKLSKLRKPDHDIGQLMNELSDPLIKQDIDNLRSNGGTIVLLAANGMHLMSSKNDLMKMFSWGWTSNPHGYADDVTVASKVGGWLSKKTKIITDPILPAKPPADDRSPVTSSRVESKTAPAPTKTETALFTDAATEYIEVKVPESIWNSNKAVKNFLQNKMDYLPKNWRDFRTASWTIKKKKVTVVKDFKEIPKEAIAAAAEAASRLSKEVTDRFIRVIPPKVLDAIKEDLDNLDKNSQEIVDPTVIQAFEQAHPSFWEQTGKSKDFTDVMTDEQILHLCVKYPVAAAILLLNYRADEIMGRPQEPPEEKDVDTSGTGVTKTENKWLAKKKEKIAL